MGEPIHVWKCVDKPVLDKSDVAVRTYIGIFGEGFN